MTPTLFRRRCSQSLVLCWASIALILSAARIGPVAAASGSAVRGVQGMVVTVDREATAVGLDVLRGGGNAVDAAVAVAFTLAVTFPRAGNLGGGGFLLYRAPDGSYEALDFREIAPRRLRAELFLDDRGRPRSESSVRGGLAVGVPGTVAGLVEAHSRWGSRPWAELVQPAVRIAEAGMIVSRRLATSLAAHGQDLAADPAAGAVFTRGGRPLREGERLVQTDLARTLRRIAAEGRDGFYRGPTAEAVVATTRRTGGVMEIEDLTAYRVIPRQPLEGRYRGHRVVSFPPPSSGGVVLLQILGMLERFDLGSSGFGSSLTIHRMAEVERRAYADRSRWLGDPGFYASPVKRLLDPDYVADRAATIRDRKATPSRRIGPGRLPRAEPGETTHFSIADDRGGAVALTTTLNAPFGAAMMAEGTGVLLNNEIDDFALAPGVPNQFGLLGGEANAVEGGKRPLSSMTPTFVEPAGGGPRPLLILGSPGGPRIITAVLQVIVNVIDHSMPLQEAVDAPRFHHQWFPDRIDHEVRAFPEDVRRALLARGHELRERSAVGNVSAVGVDEDGTWLGAADPRRGGHAAGY